VSIGEMCRTLRQQSGISLAQMAAMTHRDTSTLSRFERGHTNPRDADALVRTYRNLIPQPQARPQRSDRPRIWPLAYLSVSLPILLALTLSGPQGWDSDVARGWLGLSLAIITAAIVPTIVRDARNRRHPVAIIARAGYVCALTLITTGNLLNWNTLLSPLVLIQGIVLVGLGMITVAYDRLERENAPGK
jgi:hypothetical protein